METRANNIAIGAFVLAIVAAAFIFVFWLMSGADANKRSDVKIIFPGAVTGLPKGGQVLFNGIKIGDVTDLTFDAEDPRLVVATVRIDANAPIRRDTKASLGYTGLTGVAYVDLHGGTLSSPALIDPTSNEVPVIYASRSQFEDLIEGAKDILQKADKTLGSIETVVEQSGPEISKTISNIEVFSGALAKNADGVSEFLEGITSTAKALTSLSGRIGSLVERGEQMIADVPPEKIGEIVNNVEVITTKLSKSADGVGSIVSTAQTAADNLEEFSVGVNDSLKDVDALLAAVDPKDVQKTVKGAADLGAVITDRKEEIESILSSASEIGKNVSTLSTNIVARQDEIDQFVTNAVKASDQINAGTEQLNKVIQAVDPTKVEQIIASVDQVSGTFAQKDAQITQIIDEAASASVNINKVTKTFADRDKDVDAIIANSKQISDNLAVVSKELEATMKDASAFLDQAEQLVAAVDPKKVDSIVTSAEKVASTLSGKSDEIGQTIDEAKQAASNVNEMTGNLKAKTKDIDEIISEGKQIANNLNAASVRVNGLLNKVDGMVEGDGEGLIVEATAAAKSIRIVADAFADKAEPISQNLLRFSQQGSSDFAAAMQQLNATLVEIQRAVSNFDQNPNRVIFGGSDTPVFNGAKRR
ncbi:MCE family protein [Rhodobacteraceae bacterium RKSG542]|uniref:MlaD family protein n=1 Tax=Pseudovibrio flavus TaxID=2529854 RepID=UPI0012BC1196|nr:MCE family protein [Pseudovibrio flavus]MTI19239.1 MCE family protein [Pseudovibrio flavus]